MDRAIRDHRDGLPFDSPKLAIEIADRHTQSIERHGLTPDDMLYGLKPPRASMRREAIPTGSRASLILHGNIR